MIPLQRKAQPSETSPRVLVVEDEFYIAEDLVEALSAAGLDVVGPAYSVPEALQSLQDDPNVQGAIIDMTLRDQLAIPVADALLSLGVRYDRNHLEARYRVLDHFEKPFDPAKVIAKLQEKMSFKQA